MAKCDSFVVDIYNEGVDISEVNTVLFLRPTESLMYFFSSWAEAFALVRTRSV